MCIKEPQGGGPFFVYTGHLYKFSDLGHPEVKIHVNSQVFHSTRYVRLVQTEASLDHKHGIRHSVCRASAPACQNTSISLLEQGINYTESTIVAHNNTSI